MSGSKPSWFHKLEILLDSRKRDLSLSVSARKIPACAERGECCWLRMRAAGSLREGSSRCPSGPPGEPGEPGALRGWTGESWQARAVRSHVETPAECRGAVLGVTSRGGGLAQSLVRWAEKAD